MDNFIIYIILNTYIWELYVVYNKPPTYYQMVLEPTLSPMEGSMVVQLNE